MAQRQDIAVGCLLVVALGAAAVMATFAGAFRGGWSTIEVTVPAADVAGLQQSADVAVVGIRVGRVERLELKRDQALVHLRLDPDADLRQDTTARIRARSVLGEKYLELVPHDPDAPLLRDGDVLAQEAVLYAVTAPDGDRLPYATDTGALPASTIACSA